MKMKMSIQKHTDANICKVFKSEHNFLCNMIMHCISLNSYRFIKSFFPICTAPNLTIICSSFHMPNAFFSHASFSYAVLCKQKWYHRNPFLKDLPNLKIWYFAGLKCFAFSFTLGIDHKIPRKFLKKHMIYLSISNVVCNRNLGGRLDLKHPLWILIENLIPIQHFKMQKCMLWTAEYKRVAGKGEGFTY